VETDCPFLAPVPNRGKRNEPLFVTHTISQIAGLKNETPEKIASITAENAKELFSLPQGL